MAKVIITAIGSAGDVHPLIGIGVSLAACGHRIVFCTHAPFAELARRHGFTFVPIGTREEYETAMSDPALWHPATSFKTLWKVIAPTLRPHFDKLTSLIDADTVLVGTLWAFSARLVQELHGVPFVSVQVSPSTLLSAHAPPTHKRLTIPKGLPLALKAGLLKMVEHRVLDKVCGPALNALRRELGLLPVQRIMSDWLHSTDGILCLFPEWFARPQPDWPEPHMLSGFPVFNDIGTATLDPGLEDFLAAGAPPLVFTPGSTLIDSARYALAVEDALRAIGQRGILLTPDASSTDMDNPSRTLLRRRYVPLGSLLPRCRALVHHGGIGTAALAYAAGIPQIVTPFAHDQFDNAERVAASGCGIRIDTPVNGRSLARAIERVLTSRSIALQCGHMRDRLSCSINGCDAAARYIGRFAPPPVPGVHVDALEVQQA